MKTYVETLSSSDEGDEVVEVPFVKPKPPVIVLSCSEEEEDEVSPASANNADVRIINGSQPSSSEARGQTDSSHSAKKSKRKDPEKDKSGRAKSKSGRTSEGSRRNVEPGSVISSETVPEPLGADESEAALPMIRISSNIFDPSHTALVDTTDRVPPADVPVPRFVLNPVGPASRTKRVPPPDAQPPKKRAPVTRKRAVSDPTTANQGTASTNTAEASESSFVSFLRSINLPVPDEFLTPPKPKRKTGGGRKRKTAGTPYGNPPEDPADGLVTITQEVSPTKKGRASKKGTGTPTKKTRSPAAALAFLGDADDEAPLTQADLASVNIDIQHNIVNPETPKTSKRKNQKKTGETENTTPASTGSPKKRKQRGNDSQTETPVSRKRLRNEPPASLGETRDDNMATPPSAIPTTWTKEMSDFYCKPDRPNFEHDDVLRKIPSTKKKWKASLDDGNRNRDRILTVKQRREKHLRCDNCKQRGHIKFKCPEKPKGKVCILCGEDGHLNTEMKCREDRNICLNCGQLTQTRKTQTGCNQCLYRSRPVECSLCRMKGHLEPTCPDHWRRYHSTTVDVPELLRRRETLREEIAQRKVEIEQIDVAGADAAVKKAEDEVVAKQKKVIGPKLSQQKKLEQVEAAEKEMHKTIGRRKKILNSVAAGQEWIKETEATIRELENQIRAEGPEVVDVETDQMDGSEKGFKYKPRYMQYCSNCGGKGHNYFLCKGSRMKQPPYFPNKPFVIQELQVPIINFTKTVETTATKPVATCTVTKPPASCTVTQPPALCTVTQPPATCTVTEPPATSTVTETGATTTATKSVVRKPSPATTVTSDPKASSPAQSLPRKNTKEDTSTRVSDKYLQPIQTGSMSNPFAFLRPQSEPNANLPGVPTWPSFGSAQRNPDNISSGVQLNYSNDDVPSFFTSFDRPFQPDTLIQFPEAFRRPPPPPLPAFLSVPPPPMPMNPFFGGPSPSTPILSTGSQGSLAQPQPMQYSHSKDYSKKYSTDWSDGLQQSRYPYGSSIWSTSASAPETLSAPNARIPDLSLNLNAPENPRGPPLFGGPPREQEKTKPSGSQDGASGISPAVGNSNRPQNSSQVDQAEERKKSTSMVDSAPDSVAQANETNEKLPSPTDHGEASPPELPIHEDKNAPTPTDFRVTSTSSDLPSAALDMDERVAHYIPVPVPVPVPAEQFEALLKTGMQGFGTSTNYASALMTNPAFLSQFRIQCQALANNVTVTSPAAVVQSKPAPCPVDPPPVPDEVSTNSKIQAATASRGPSSAAPDRPASPEVQLVGEVVEPMGSALKESETLRMRVLPADYRVLVNCFQEITNMSRLFNVDIELVPEDLSVMIMGASKNRRHFARIKIQSIIERKTGRKYKDNDTANSQLNSAEAEASLNVTLLPSEWDLFSAEEDKLVKQLRLGLEVRLSLKKDDKSVTITGADTARRTMAKENIVLFLQAKAAGVPYVPKFITGKSSSTDQQKNQNNQRSSDKDKGSRRSGSGREDRRSRSRSSSPRSGHRDRDSHSPREHGHHGYSHRADDRYEHERRRYDDSDHGTPRNYSNHYYNRNCNRRYDDRRNYDNYEPRLRGSSRDRETSNNNPGNSRNHQNSRLDGDTPRPRRPARYFDQPPGK